jgi:hypothetical protein
VIDNFNLAPIVFFAYNRPIHTELTINALIKNELASKSDLIIFSDGAKNELDISSVNQVRNYLKTICGFRSIKIVERTINLGLGNNIIEGVTSVVNNYGKVIVLEDDLLTSPYFLQYMNAGLEKYESAKNVISIHSYIYPIKKKLPETYFIKGADCLGWGTWKEKWDMFEQNGFKLLTVLEERGLTKAFDFNNSYPYTQMLRDQIAGKNSSWAIRWYASAFINDMLTLYPARSLVYHNGNDGSGTNFGISSILDVKLTEIPIKVGEINIAENVSARKNIELYLQYTNASFLRILYRKVKRRITTYIKSE